MEKLTIKELIALCKERKIKGYSGLRLNEIKELIEKHNPVQTQTLTIQETPPVSRLNYIGSKYQLLEWITTNIKEKTGFNNFNNKTIADLFAGTGIVSHHFRGLGAKVLSNDAELYSSIISHAFTCSTYSPTCEQTIKTLISEINANKHLEGSGFITDKYSPQGEARRKFFTVENAKQIDYLRNRLDQLKPILSKDDYMFLLASLLLSADAVSNVPAVYGCFLQNFKSKAIKALTLKPIHTNTTQPKIDSATFNEDVLTLAGNLPKSDVVYLDPPYNGRQYSKNYFPLNMIALTPEEQSKVPPLKGKTGIPVDCFISPFCKKGKTVEDAFEHLFKTLKTKWIFLSYNSESTVPKDKMIELMNKYGTASVVERDYKRFKSYEYNNDVQIKEYLFCLKKNL